MEWRFLQDVVVLEYDTIGMNGERDIMLQLQGVQRGCVSVS